MHDVAPQVTGKEIRRADSAVSTETEKVHLCNCTFYKRAKAFMTRSKICTYIKHELYHDFFQG